MYANSLNRILNQSELDKESQEIVSLLQVLVQNNTNGGDYSQEDLSNVRDAIEDVLRRMQGKVEARLATI